MKKETFDAIACILGNGYTCFVNKKTEEVFSAEAISLAEQKSTDYQAFEPLES